MCIKVLHQTDNRSKKICKLSTEGLFIIIIKNAVYVKHILPPPPPPGANGSYPRSHAIEMVFVFIVIGHAGSSARSLMLSQKMTLGLSSWGGGGHNITSVQIQLRQLSLALLDFRR